MECGIEIAEIRGTGPRSYRQPPRYYSLFAPFPESSGWPHMPSPPCLRFYTGYYQHGDHKKSMNNNPPPPHTFFSLEYANHPKTQ